MSDVVLATANARYSHAALGLRYLKANLRRGRDSCRILEFVLDDWPERMAERILAERPRVVGLGVSIWNVELMGKLCGLLKALRPESSLILGGPEMIAGDELPGWARQADYVVSGEGEQVFADLCEALLAGEAPDAWLHRGRVADLGRLRLPYEEYDAEDIARRVLYIESSRGCPYGCEFCLSSLDRNVRRFPMDRVLSAMESLWSRGARRFKFVDRSLHLSEADRLLEFFGRRADDPELFVHFELVPEACDDALLSRLAEFPAGRLQLEVGVQSFNAEVCARVGRRCAPDRVEQALRRLRTETRAHLHADLLLGLPGESLESIASSFDRLWAIGPQEVQVGVLKRLPGAPIARHDEAFGMIYRAYAPYDVLQTAELSFDDLQSLKRFARHFERLVNSGNFRGSMARILRAPSPFLAFRRFSAWLFEKTGQEVGLSISRAAGLIFEYLRDELALEEQAAARSLVQDFEEAGRSKGLGDDIRRRAGAGRA